MSLPLLAKSEPEPKLLLSINESARLLSVSPVSIRRLIGRGLLKPVRLWRHIRIPRAQIEALIKV